LGTRLRLAQVIAELRVRGFTQKDIAKEIELSPSYFSAILNGHRALQPAVAHAIEERFGYRASWLLRGNGLPRTDSEPIPGGTTTTAPAVGAKVLIRKEYYCEACGGRVGVDMESCPHCLSDLIWPDENEATGI